MVKLEIAVNTEFLFFCYFTLDQAKDKRILPDFASNPAARGAYRCRIPSIGGF
jgi:hypothetical protein